MDEYDKKAGVAVPARRIPIPASISHRARAALARQIGEDGVPHNARHTMPLPNDHDGWIALKTIAEQHYAAATNALAGTLRARVETIRAEGAAIHVATPDEALYAERVLLDFHGGAFVFGGGEACRIQTRGMAHRHGVVCHGVDYRMPPEYPFPAALDDAVSAYRALLARYDPAHIVVSGRSAGGNLAAALMLRAKVERLAMPAGLILLSPEVDLTESGDSFQTNRLIDVVLPGSLMASNRLYAGAADLADPLLSPLFGDLAGFPPTLLQAGTRDLFLSNTVRLHRRLRGAGVAADLHVFEAMPHGGFTGSTPEDEDLDREISRFLATCWG